jgi:hypothetical protein
MKSNKPFTPTKREWNVRSFIRLAGVRTCEHELLPPHHAASGPTTETSFSLSPSFPLTIMPPPVQQQKYLSSSLPPSHHHAASGPAAETSFYLSLSLLPHCDAFGPTTELSFYLSPSLSRRLLSDNGDIFLSLSLPPRHAASGPTTETFSYRSPSLPVMPPPVQQRRYLSISLPPSPSPSCRLRSDSGDRDLVRFK